MMAPRITPGRGVEMQRAVQTCETAPVAAIETLRRLAEEDAAYASGH